MNKYKVNNFFYSNFELKESTKGWYRFINPWDTHGDSSMAVNFDYMRVRDFRSGYNKSVIDFIKNYKNLNYQQVLETVDKYTERTYKISVPMVGDVVIKIPDHTYPLLAQNSLCNRAANYLISRNLDVERLDSMGFGVCISGEWIGYIIIPVKASGKLNYFFGRDFIGNYLRYKNPTNLSSKRYFYNEDALYLHDSVNLLEGWTDAETLGEASVASLSWTISDEQLSKLIHSPCKQIVMVCDKGFYKEGLINAARIVDHKKIKVISVDHLEGKDVNDIGKDIIQNEIEKSPVLTMTDIFSLI